MTLKPFVSRAMCATLAFTALFAGTQVSQADQAVLIGATTGGVDGGRDAFRFGQALVDSGAFSADDIVLLTGSSLTRARVLQAVTEDVQRATRPGDRVIIYFSGPGGQRPGAAVEDEPDGMDEVLILDDTTGAALWDNELEAAINALEGRKVSVFLDTAFAALKDAPTSLGYRGAGRLGPLVEEVLVGVASETLPKKPSISDLPLEVPKGTDAILEPIMTSLAEPGPLKTDNPGAEIWSASAGDGIALEDEEGGALTSVLVSAVESNVADQNGNGTTSSAEFLALSLESLAGICAQSIFCEGSGQSYTPSRVVADNRLALLSPSDDTGRVISDAQPFGNADAFGESLATEIPQMVYEERLSFVSDRFGSINRADLTLGILPGQHMKVGDIVQFELTSQHDGNFILIDVDPLGRVVQVYPSALSPKDSTRVRAGTAVQIPSILSSNGMPLRIRVTPPVGKGFLMAVFVEGDLSEIETLLPEDLAGGPVLDGFAFLYELADGLMGMTASAGPAPQIWSTQYVEYEIFE